ncbi:Gfo/Idh/MocA family oxidoreductase [Vibrio wakamikoensis]|uniref:Gfo/Idh/MocA family protein n=1 Tax=Vibrio TaxID=662 RepID=UPI003AB8877B
MIKWGVMGPGRIAHNFAKGIAVTDGAVIQAVASRNEKRATQFAGQYQIETIYSDYQALTQDPEVDIIYIATPHAFHYEQALMCLNAGKAVMCEKALTMTAEQSRYLHQVSKEQGVFIMEAFWSKFLPAWEQIQHWKLKIGDIKLVQSNFCFKAERNYSDRLFDPIQGGGALHDIGIYNIALSNYVFDQLPIQWQVLGTVGETGVEESVSAVLEYEGDSRATFTCSFNVTTPNTMTIFGEHGRIEIAEPFFGAEKATLVTDSANEVFEIPHAGAGFEYQIAEANACLQLGKIESGKHPMQATIDTLEIIGEMRRSLGIGRQ